jgi:hypothetical protein
MSNPLRPCGGEQLFLQGQHTCEPVSMELSTAPVWVFQNLMHLSAVPPPVASRLLWKGHQASALTAACDSIEAAVADLGLTVHAVGQ